MHTSNKPEQTRLKRMRPAGRASPHVCTDLRGVVCAGLKYDPVASSFFDPRKRTIWAGRPGHPAPARHTRHERSAATLGRLRRRCGW